jgi:pyruvate/2-oxoglutarate dehydrogenase complex dihydrolipoamide dehydrogenase (E3) component
MTDLPASLVIGGAGPIACEFAQALNRLGVRVTLVLRGDAPLRGEEPEARETLLRVLGAEGVTVVTGARGFAAREVPGGRELSWDGGSATAEHLLIATGREPRVDETDPAEGGIELDDGGARVDRNLQTTAPGVWALGDAIGGEHRRYQFTHVATHEGPQVAENALLGAHHEPAYTAMPRVTFTDPEVASVGLTEAEARERGIRAHAHVKLVGEVGKARAIGEREGFVKVVIDRETGKLIGATVMAAHAGDMLATLTTPLHTRQGDLGPLLATTFAHPTLSEAIKVAVRDAVAGAAEPEEEMTT